jgi:hypothetical protein
MLPSSLFLVGKSDIHTFVIGKCEFSGIEKLVRGVLDFSLVIPHLDILALARNSLAFFLEDLVDTLWFDRSFFFDGLTQLLFYILA